MRPAFVAAVLAVTATVGCHHAERRSCIGVMPYLLRRPLDAPEPIVHRPIHAPGRGFIGGVVVDPRGGTVADATVVVVRRDPRAPR